MLGRERDPAKNDRVGAIAQRSKLNCRDCDAQHLGHLGVCERGADTTSNPTAEGEPRVGLGTVLDEPLGPELVRPRVQVLAHVHERDPRVNLHPGRQLPARDRPGCGERALGGIDHRAQSQGLLDDRVEVGVVVAGFKLLAQAGQHARVAQQQLEGKGETRRGRLVPSAEHREQLIAQLRVRHRLALLVTCAQQQREHVGALLEVRLLPASLDFLIQHGVRRAQTPRKAPARAQRSQVCTCGREHKDWAAVDDRDQPSAQALDPLGLCDTEHGSADHLECKCAHALAEHQRCAWAPPRDLSLGHIVDDLPKSGHSRALKRR